MNRETNSFLNESNDRAALGVLVLHVYRAIGAALLPSAVLLV
jgi:hypothetical protein